MGVSQSTRGQTIRGFGLPIEVGTGWQEKSITVGPWNNADEYPGILARDTEGALTYYLNASGTKLDSGRQVGQGFVGYQITQIDFDGDGNQDIAARNTSGTMLLFRSDGGGDSHSTNPVRSSDPGGT